MHSAEHSHVVSLYLELLRLALAVVQGNLTLARCCVLALNTATAAFAPVTRLAPYRLNCRVSGRTSLLVEHGNMDLLP